MLAGQRDPLQPLKKRHVNAITKVRTNVLRLWKRPKANPRTLKWSLLVSVTLSTACMAALLGTHDRVGAPVLTGATALLLRLETR